MSMIGNFRSVSDEDIRALLEQPQRVTRLLYGEEVLPGSDGSRFLSWFNRGSQTSGPDTWEPGSDGEELDVDKAWHGIHFLPPEQPGRVTLHSISSSAAVRRSGMSTSATAPRGR